MLESIQGAYNGVKAAMDAVQGIMALKTEVDRSAAILDVQRVLVDTLQKQLLAQQDASTLHKRIEALEAELAQLKDWSAEMEQYELADAGQGALAYRRKESVDTSEAEIWLCPTCYENRKKSILQPDRYRNGAARVLRCHPCGQQLVIRGHVDLLNR